MSSLTSKRTLSPRLLLARAICGILVLQFAGQPIAAAQAETLESKLALFQHSEDGRRLRTEMSHLQDRIEGLSSREKLVFYTKMKKLTQKAQRKLERMSDRKFARRLNQFSQEVTDPAQTAGADFSQDSSQELTRDEIPAEILATSSGTGIPSAGSSPSGQSHETRAAHDYSGAELSASKTEMLNSLEKTTNDFDREIQRLSGGRSPNMIAPCIYVGLTLAIVICSIVFSGFIALLFIPLTLIVTLVAGYGDLSFAPAAFLSLFVPFIMFQTVFTEGCAAD